MGFMGAEAAATHAAASMHVPVGMFMPPAAQHHSYFQVSAEMCHVYSRIIL